MSPASINLTSQHLQIEVQKAAYLDRSTESSIFRQKYRKAEIVHMKCFRVMDRPGRNFIIIANSNSHIHCQEEQCDDFGDQRQTNKQKLYSRYWWGKTISGAGEDAGLVYGWGKTVIYVHCTLYIVHRLDCQGRLVRRAESLCTTQNCHLSISVRLGAIV